MAAPNKKLENLRALITENLRIQRDSNKRPPYIDVTSALPNVCARQNHTIFARRGCGKTLLLHHSSSLLDDAIKSVYLNCEDFKRHSFPNVLIEIIDALFAELERHLTGWFGKKKKSRQIIQNIRKELSNLKKSSDTQEESVRTLLSTKKTAEGSVVVGMKDGGNALSAQADMGLTEKEETERSYRILSDKIRELDMLLPSLKQQVREFFELSNSVQAVFLQVDDFYHLKKTDQPFVADYIHRLCKDLPLYFKIATLRHASTLYADRDGQPIGAQERHDYQPINIDYTFSDFQRTRNQNLQILREFGKLSGLTINAIDALFKGEGFNRLVMAGGGVPRDTLSLFLEILSTVDVNSGEKIGKDDVRILSRSNFERRIEELKQDSEGGEQDKLIRGIYVLREFCLKKRTNVFVISEQLLQQHDKVRDLINRLLDYRIIHNCGAALTHKSQPGTYQAFAIDIGCYAHLRKLDGRFSELDLTNSNAKEKMRSAPTFNAEDFKELWESAPKDIEASLLRDVIH